MFEYLLLTGKKRYPDNVKFLGEIAASELINGTLLANMVGLTAGTSQNANEPWLAWEIDGKTVLYSKKTYRHSLSWDHLNAVNIISDAQKLVLRGKEYFIGLPKGTNPNSSVPVTSGVDIPYSHNSEWNRLMYPIVQATSTHPKLSQIGPNQANYTGIELGFEEWGYRIWSRETLVGSPSQRVIRGNGGVSGLYGITSSDSTMPHGWRPRLELIGDALPAGVFLGEVPVSELITGDSLAAAAGLTAGVSQYSNEPWLKWEIDGKVVYYSKKPYRHSIPYNALAAADLTQGSRIITIQGRQYRIGLPQGLNPTSGYTWNPEGFDNAWTHNSEWNRLMYPICLAAGQSLKISQSGVNQASYTEAQLGLISTSGPGGYSWCAELVPLAGNITNRIGRGYSGLCYGTSITPTYAATAAGWRPRLELIA